MASGRTLFVGDIHGCAAEFAELLAKLDHDPVSDRLYLAGDAFTRGPDPLGVWRTIQSSRAEMVLGNHDDRLRARLRYRLSGLPDRPMKESRRRAVELLGPVARELADWLEERPLYIEGDQGWILVHAGIHPERGLAGTTRDDFMRLRTWPPTGDLSAPRWHDSYAGERLVIFGHDAPRGLVVRRRRDGSPYAIGLDSGCVFGGLLSAYILEEDRIVQVRSHAAWAGTGGNGRA